MATKVHIVGDAIFSARDWKRLPSVIVDKAMQVMSADDASLMLADADGRLELVHSFGLSGNEAARSGPVRFENTVAGRVAMGRKPVLLNTPVAEDPRFSGVTSHGRVRSAIVYPLFAGETLVGILNINRRTKPEPFDEEDVERASILASQVLLAIENSRLMTQVVGAERKAVIGQLAAGMAHEINTPLQYIGDSIEFLQGAFAALETLLARYREEMAVTGRVPSAVSEALDATEESLDLDYMREKTPAAFARARAGIAKVAQIVLEIKKQAEVENGENDDARAIDPESERLPKA